MGELNQNVVMHPLVISQYSADESNTLLTPVGQFFIIDDFGNHVTDDFGNQLITGN